MKSTYILIIILALVVIGGVLYVLRPGLDYRLKQEITVVEETPVDNTQAWPPVNGATGESLPFKPKNEMVTVKLATSLGDIQILLDGTRAPLTVGNFVYLAEQGFYNGTAWHRVIPDFMIQGGDPLSKDQSQREKHGQGGTDYKFKDEINAASYGLDKQRLIDVIAPEQAQQLGEQAKQMSVKQFYEAQGYQYTTEVESLPLKRGVVAMANSGPNTNGSQFFIITAEDVSHLAGKHTPFGIVHKGMDVVDKIEEVETDSKDNPVEPVIINNVTVIEGGLLPGLETVK